MNKAHCKVNTWELQRWQQWHKVISGGLELIKICSAFQNPAQSVQQWNKHLHHQICEIKQYFLSSPYHQASNGNTEIFKNLYVLIKV